MHIDLEEDDITLEPDAPAPLMAFDRSMRSYTVDGYLHVEGCKITAANVCPYMGSEIPESDVLGLEPMRVYNLYRDPKEIEAAAATYERIPLMMGHIVVTADNPQKFLIVGTVSNVRFRFPYLLADLTFWDRAAINAIEAGEQRALSVGYRYRADMTPGLSSEGVEYDGVMRNIIANHLALVEAGRAGPDIIVADSNRVTLHESLSTRQSAIASARHGRDPRTARRQDYRAPRR